MDPEAIAATCGFAAGPWIDLLLSLGIDDPEAWCDGWRRRLEQQPGPAALPRATLWGLALPLLARMMPLLAGGGRSLVGLNGPVGAGKTTLLRALELLGPSGHRLAIASIDDLYLPWEERRRQLAGNPFGVLRGPPGSHDVDLLQERLAGWLSGGALHLPRFDKRLRRGQGDRSGHWSGTPEVLLLEGWLLGCRSLPDQALKRRLQPLLGAGAASGSGPVAFGLDAAELAWLPTANSALRRYEPLWAELQTLWLLRPGDWSWPRRWRFQAEARQRRAGGASLAPGDLNQLVRACGACLPAELYQDPLIPLSEAVVELDGLRRPCWVGRGQKFLRRRERETAARP